MPDRMTTDCDATTACISTAAPAGISRRELMAWGTALGLAPCAALASAHNAHNYPNRPITLIAGATSGGAVDIGARILSQPLSEILGVPVIVENKPGATGVISTKYVGKAPEDGYTLLVCTPSAGIVGPLTMPTNPFNPLKEIVGVNMITTNPLGIAVNPGLKIDSLKDLIALSRKRQVTLGVPGIGGVADFLVKQLNKATGSQFESVPYKGLGSAIVDAMGGQIDGAAADLGPFLASHQGGKLKILAVTSPERAPLLPAVPTVGETYPGFVAHNWLAIFAPARTPPAILDKINAALLVLVARNDVRSAFQQSAGIMAPMKSPAEFQKFVASEYQRWSVVLREQGLIKG